MAEFSLQLLHVTDQEGAAPALVDAPNLSAVLNALEDDFENTLILSSGDLWLPGLFYSASTEVYGFENAAGEFEGVPGIADILINSALGFEAVAFGNHEFDQGTRPIAALLAANPNITGPGIGEEGYQGAAFPYLSANLDFAADPNLADLVVEDGQDVSEIPGKIAKSAITTVGGEKIGIVGATTPTLPTVSSPGDDVAVSPADPEDYDKLAAIIQAEVDELLANNPDLNKVILLAHTQVLDIEVNELAPRLTGVDIIIGGGSDTILADETDRLRDGDEASGPYPIIQAGADGNPIAIVTTDGQYLYVGQLVVDFDANGILILDSIDPIISGAYATDDEGVAALDAEGLTDPIITEVIAALNGVIEEKERNVFGITDVFLNGRRSGGGLDGVRNQETNLGNLTAEANLWYARLFDEEVDISIKNGGGIRESIGAVVTPPGGTEPVRLPPEGSPNFNKPAGGITQTDVESVLAFNNGLSIVTTTVAELKAILEHAVSGATAENINSDFGSFAQVAGIQFSFDIAFEPGNRVRSLTLVDDAGNDTEVLVQNGAIQGDPTRTYRLVTLNFLANGGSEYPIPQTDRVDLIEQGDFDQDLADFAELGFEQDAFAEYLAAFFPADDDPATPAFMIEDTVVSEDERIQNLFFRNDTVIDGPVPPIGKPEEPDFSDGFEGPFSEIGRLLLAEGAEINSFDPASATLFVVSGGSVLQAVDLSDPAKPVLSELIDLSVFGGGVNSVAVKNGVVALSVEARTSTDDGAVVFLTTDGQFLARVKVGAVPDMVTFTPDGSKVLVANEGEPNADYSIDPEGSISIIDLSNGAENATIATADFAAFNGQKAELQAEGVKLFGLDATVAEDLEPEYIAVSPDGSTAWVTLQENNAIAVVDIESATVQAILPLGVKDFSKGQPELTSYEISDRGPITNGGDPLVTATGETIELGGFSGLFYDGVAENGNLKFLAVPDRGPNGDVTDGNRPFLLPDYQARIQFLELNESTGAVTITDELFLTREDGTPITGLPNIPGVDERAVDATGAFVDLDFLDGFDEYGTDYDPLGADMEGIVRAPDGTYWTVDEYRPAIYHFDTNGTLISRFVPEGTVDQANAANPGANFASGTFGTETLPTEYSNRLTNRGFEGMALDTDEGILYAFIQTPLSNPDRDTGDNSTVIRMLGIDPTSGEPVAEYVYLLQKPDIGNNVDKIGDAVYAGDGKFFVIERDSSLEPTAQKFIFEVALKGATNVLGEDFGGETLEQQTADSLAALGINPVNKIKVTNLPSLGYLPSDKPEGLAYLPDGRLVVLNDNDFGLVPGAEGVELGVIDFGAGNQLDASNRDDGINIRNWPVFGLYQPDSIASYEVNGVTYYVTANEGDARIRPDGDLEDEDGNVILEEGKIFNEESRIGDDDIVLDPEAFPNAAELKQDENLGRLKITNTLGDIDGDGDFDQLFSYGGRSFSIWDENGNLVFDSGDDIANITAQLTPELFNANSGDPEEFDERSDDKGAEPEGLTVGQIGDKTYAFVSLERAGGGVLIYDITNPAEAQFVQYVRSDEDIAPEGLTFISDIDSPNGNNLLIVANEVSSTLTVYSDGDGGDGGDGGTGTTSIFDIQGAGHISPLVGETVTTVGIVTAVESNGLYLQDAEGDGDIATSDALFVFTGDAPSVAVGDELNVTGTVSEFTPGGIATGNLSTTQISGSPMIAGLSSGNDLPAAVILGAEGRIPPNVSIDDDAFASFDPETDGIDFFESLEAMRVTAQDAVAITGTNRFGEIFAVVDGGDSATGISDRGTLNISPDDFNPERVQIDADSDILPDFEFPQVDTGAMLGDVTGVISYEFGNFQINPTEPFTPIASDLMPKVSTIVKGDDTLTVASYNVLNLDPNDSDGDTDIADGRFTAISEQIVNNLNAPDIIGLQEIQDNSGSVDDGTVAADETLQLLVAEIAAAGGPQYEFIDNTFITDGASGGQPGGNIRTAFLYNPERVGLVDGSVKPVGDQAAGSPFAGARLPLAATFAFNGEVIAIVNNHFSSKGGSAPILGVEQPFEQRQEDPDVNGSLNERRVQAQAVNTFADDIFAEDADANVVVLGDLNEFEFISPLEILAGTVESTDNGFGIQSTGTAAMLNNLVNTVDPDERYSFIFQGNSQVLDHILVSDSLFTGAEFDLVYVNAEFAETDNRASDHEPILASFDFSDNQVMPVKELLDLTGFDGEVTANLILSREAAFDNLLQFYETDAEGAVGGLLPGEAGYEDAVRQNLISGLELFVENLTTTDTDVLLGGGTYYAPALLVNGDLQNLVTIDDASLGMSMIQREGNVWRFEDLTDFDFNDFVLTLNSAEAAIAAA